VRTLHIATKSDAFQQIVDTLTNPRRALEIQHSAVDTMEATPVLLNGSGQGWAPTGRW
jgi:hypothetical protein